MDNVNKFGIKLKAIRKNMQLTQKDLSKRSGYSQNAISQWENGKREPDSLNDIHRLAAALGIPVDYFFNDELPPVKKWKDDLPLKHAGKLKDEHQDVYDVYDHKSLFVNEDNQLSDEKKKLINRLFNLPDEKIYILNKLIDSWTNE